MWCRATPKKAVPTKVHTEHKTQANVYSTMLPCTVMLDAEPQIGKTGAFMSLIELLYVEHINGAVYVAPRLLADAAPLGNAIPKELKQEFTGGGEVEKVERVKSQEELVTDLKYGTFQQRSAYLRNEVNSRGTSSLSTCMNDVYEEYHKYFEEYHKLLLASRERYKNTNELIVQHVFKNVVDVHEDRDWRVADCGCGMYGFGPSLNAAMNKNPKWIGKVKSIYIKGMDMNKAVESCIIKEQEHAKLSFQGVVEVITNLVDEVRRYDMVVFNCSLWLNSTKSCLSWAYRNLDDGLYLIIVELIRRLPQTWMDDMEKMGWAQPCTEDFYCNTFDHDPYIISVWTKTAAKPIENADLVMLD